MSTVQVKVKRWLEVGKLHHCQTKSQRISLEQSFRVVSDIWNTQRSIPSPPEPRDLWEEFDQWMRLTISPSGNMRCETCGTKPWWNVMSSTLLVYRSWAEICCLRKDLRKEKWTVSRWWEEMVITHVIWMILFFSLLKFNSPSAFFLFTLRWLMAQRFPWVWCGR